MGDLSQSGLPLSEISARSKLRAILPTSCWNCKYSTLLDYYYPFIHSAWRSTMMFSFKERLKTSSQMGQLESEGALLFWQVHQNYMFPLIDLIALCSAMWEIVSEPPHCFPSRLKHSALECSQVTSLWLNGVEELFFRSQSGGSKQCQSRMWGSVSL